MYTIDRNYNFLRRFQFVVLIVVVLELGLFPGSLDKELNAVTAAGGPELGIPVT